jgi:hypothetical protein
MRKLGYSVMTVAGLLIAAPNLASAQDQMAPRTTQPPAQQQLGVTTPAYDPAQAQAPTSASRLSMPDTGRRLSRAEMDAHEREITKQLNQNQLQRMQTMQPGAGAQPMLDDPHNP